MLVGKSGLKKLMLHCGLFEKSASVTVDLLFPLQQCRHVNEYVAGLFVGYEAASSVIDRFQQSSHGLIVS